MRFGTKNFLDYCFLLLIYLQLAILEFFGLGQILNKIITFALVVYMVFSFKKYWKTGIIFIVIIPCFYLLSCIFGESFDIGNVLSNFLMQFYPIIYVYYIVLLCKCRSNVISTCLDKGFWLFNGTMLINIVVLLMQIFVPFSINAVVDPDAVIDFYPDTISGLFQYASTHIVCLFTIFIVIYDISYIKRISKYYLRVLIVFLILALIVISLFIAIESDNKALFLLLPISLFAYWISGNTGSLTKIQYFIACAYAIFVVIYMLYSINDNFQIFLNKNFVNIFELILNSSDLGSAANGSGERISIIPYAFGEASTWLFGKGFGSTYIYRSGYLAFHHFGQADFGSLLVLGGIWYLLIIICYYAISFAEISGYRFANHTFDLFIGIILILICVAVYTQCFTRTNTIFSLVLIMLAFRVRFTDHTI